MSQKKKLEEATASNKDLKQYQRIFSTIKNAKNKLYKNDSKIKEENMPSFKQFRSSIEEKTLTAAEMKKREEVAKAIERDKPNMPMGMKMAIATKTAKRVAEEQNYYSLVHKATNKVLSTHKDLDSAKDEHRGMDQDSRAHYRIATSTKEPKTSNMKEEAITSKDIKMAVGVVKDKRYAGGNMTGAVNTLEKIKKNISNHPRVQQALKTANEEVNKLEEVAGAEKRFQEYHNETAKLMKGIHSALSKHYSAHENTAHWGHVGDIRHIHDQLRDIHDRLHEQGEYNKNPNKISEEVDDEGKMAKGQLMRMVNQASALAQMMDDNKQLDGWVQSKLTMASDYLDSVHDYLMHNKQDVDEMEEEVELDEAGSFSYGVKPPKKSSVAYNAMMKRKEQNNKPPIEPKDQMVGTARLRKEETVVETKGAPKGFHFTRDGKLKRGDANQDGSGGLMLRSDPLDKQRSKVPAVSEDTEGEHYCAKHVYSNVHGEGVVLEGMHAEPDEDGNIEWYGVEFSDGPRKVFTEKLEVMVAEYHGNHKKKKRMIG